MARYIVQSELDEVSNKTDLLKVLKKKTVSTINFYEYEKILASYYLIEVCSGYEQACKKLISELLKINPATVGLKSYMLESKPLPSSNYSELCQMLEKIDGRAKVLFKKRVHDQERDALVSLYYNRQRVVHYSESKKLNITFRDVQDWHIKSLRVVKKFETVLKRYL